MCLILLAIEQHPDFPLVIAANRDEFYARPTRPLGWWLDQPEILAGRDLESGGSWLGLSKSGRLAAVTNYRAAGENLPQRPSRGELVRDFLCEKEHDWPLWLSEQGPGFNGFNLLFGHWDNLTWHSNRDGQFKSLTPGIYGLCNHLLDTPWPKVERGKAGLGNIIKNALPDKEELFTLLSDAHPAPADQLPDTGIGEEWERALSPLFIHSPTYGTRASTVLTVTRSGEASLSERSFDLEGFAGKREFRFHFEKS